jgi:pSer/pThr/pTyr-binding forkhead associated (FHA) protein
VLADELVSRRHAEICRQEWGWTIEDLASKHGTWVNEEQLRPHTPHVLRSGSEVRVANTLLTFEEVYQERDLGPEELLHLEEGPPTVEVLRIHPLIVALIAVSVVLLLVLGLLMVAVLLST